MSNYTNFNRQEGFSRIELAFLGNTVRTFLNVGRLTEDFPNKLQGLYDGYLYNDLMELCDEFIKEHEADVPYLNLALYRAKSDLNLIVEKVKDLPVITEIEAHNLV